MHAAESREDGEWTRFLFMSIQQTWMILWKDRRSKRFAVIEIRRHSPKIWIFTWIFARRFVNQTKLYMMPWPNFEKIEILLEIESGEATKHRTIAKLLIDNIFTWHWWSGWLQLIGHYLFLDPECIIFFEYWYYHRFKG